MNKLAFNLAIVAIVFIEILCFSTDARVVCAYGQNQNVPLSSQAGTDSGNGSRFVAPAGIAASIDGQDIPLSVVAVKAMQLAGPDVLNNLIDNAVIDQNAKRRGITITPSEIDSQVDCIRQALQPHTLDEMLRMRHMSLDDLRDALRVQLEVANPLLKTLPYVRMSHIREIMISLNAPESSSTKGDSLHATANAYMTVAQIRSSLKSGRSFEDLARTYSDDHSNKSEGGDVGIVTDLAGFALDPVGEAFCAQPVLVKAALGLGPGQVTAAPVECNGSLYVIQAVSTESQCSPSEKELYAEARSKVQEHQIEVRATRYVQTMRDKANVRIFLGTKAKGPDGVAATVNGACIMVSKVRDLALRVAGPPVVDKMILDRLIDRAARDRGIAVSSAEIDASMTQASNEVRPKTIQEMLQERRTSMDQFRNDLRVKLEADKLVLKSVGPARMAHIETILIVTQGASRLPQKQGTAGPHTESQAEAIMAMILRQLSAGVNFEHLARQYSEDTASSMSGGDIGVVPNSTFDDPNFVNAVSRLRKGQISAQPIKTAYGLQLVKVLSTNADFSPSENVLYARAENGMERSTLAMFENGYIASLRMRSHAINYLSQ